MEAIIEVIRDAAPKIDSAKYEPDPRVQCHTIGSDVLDVSVNMGEMGRTGLATIFYSNWVRTYE